MGGGLVNKTLTYRLDVDVEFQGWILVFATLTAGWIFCLPCWCAGLGSTTARRIAQWLSLRLPLFYFFAALFNGTWMFLLVTWLPDWAPADYVKLLLQSMLWTIGHVMKFMDSIVLIVAFIFVVAFKDRIALILGLDHRVLFRCKARDCLNCFAATRFRAIELTLWKVEDLPAADVFAANNVFVEVWGLGYNEGMKTRVHNSAGSSCILKETLHLNFDDGDEEDNLTVFIKHQGVMGGGELARCDLPATQVMQVERESKDKLANPAGLKWEDAHFCNLRLNPRGVLYFRITPVEEENGGGFVKDLTTC